MYNKYIETDEIWNVGVLDIVGNLVQLIVPSVLFCVDCNRQTESCKEELACGEKRKYACIPMITKNHSIANRGRNNFLKTIVEGGSEG